MKRIRDTRKGRREMARAYVEKDGEWNVFSTVVDDYCSYGEREGER